MNSSTTISNIAIGAWRAIDASALPANSKGVDRLFGWFALIVALLLAVGLRLDARAETAAPPAWPSAPRALPGRYVGTPLNAQKPLQSKGFSLVAPTGFEPALPP